MRKNVEFEAKQKIKVSWQTEQFSGDNFTFLNSLIWDILQLNPQNEFYIFYLPVALGGGGRVEDTA